MAVPSRRRLVTIMAQLFWLAVVLLLALVGPLIFPAAQAGYGSMPVLATRVLLPAIGGLVLLSVLLWRSHRVISKVIVLGAAAGAFATLPLEVVRLIGFHYGYMPGNLPRLMGVLLLNRLAQGPSPASDIAGWAYHFWNGASFGILFVALFGARRRSLAVLYGIAIGVGFMLSPVVASLGVGFFGLEFSRGFPVTVLTAHFAFGGTLGVLARICFGKQPSLLWVSVLEAFARQRPRGTADTQRHAG
jgi:hypothetical protein